MLTTQTNHHEGIASQNTPNIPFAEGSKEFELFRACNASPEDIAEFLAIMNEVPVSRYPQLFYLCAMLGYSLADAVSKQDGVMIYPGNIRNAALEKFDNLYGDKIPYEVRNFIDYESVAWHYQSSEALAEFSFAGATYTVMNADCL